MPGTKDETEPKFGARSRLGLFLGPALLALVLLTPAPAGLSRPGWNVVGLALLMATWWISEALPVAATALSPLALIPLLGLGNMDQAARPFADPVIFLLMGGMVIALAVERHGLHRRIALGILGRASSSRPGIIAGIMVAAAFMSMWVSNTSMALLMFPIGLSIIRLVGDEGSEFGSALMLGIGYATLIGGVATIVGTPPNALTAAFLAQTAGGRPSFLEWMLVGAPVAIVLLPAAWFILTRIAFRLPPGRIEGWKDQVRSEKRRLGPMRRAEILVAIVFLLTAALWLSLPLLSNIPGFVLDETSVAVFGALLTFLLPTSLRRGEFLMDWQTALKLPWGLLILFGGGLSLASAIQRTGLADWGAARLGGLGDVSLILLMLIVTIVAVFASEIMSNTATAATILPIAGALATVVGRDAWYLVLPVGFGASLAFMMPVGTPSNAIVYASGQFALGKMARVGLLMNLASVCVVTIVVYALVANLH